MHSLFQHWLKSRKVCVLIGLLLLVIGMTGCTIVIQPLYYQVTGKVTIGENQLPLAGVEVRMSGPVDRTTYTDSKGNYAINNLLRGNYTVTVQGPFGDDISHLYVKENTVNNINLLIPFTFNLNEFYLMSGLWDLYAKSGGGLGKGTGLGTWLWPTGVFVPVYLDANNHATTTMINHAQTHLSNWAELTDNRVSSNIYLGFRPATATHFIQVQWVGSGQIPIYEEEAAPGTVGLAVVKKFDTQGYLQQVLVLVDKDYGDVYTSLVLAHEFGHVVGAGHSEDPNSMMYPYVTGSPSQRNYFTEPEQEYMRVMYYLAPGLRLNYPSGTLASMTTLSTGPSVRTTLISTDGKAKDLNGIPAGLAALPAVQEIFGSDVSSTGGSSGMLWDSITF